MSNGLQHEEARNALEALALDALDASERAAVLTHVLGCSACRYELTELENVAAQLTYAVLPVPMGKEARDRVKGRLIQRLTTGHHDAPRDSGGDAARIRASGFRTTPEKTFPILVPSESLEPLPADIVHPTSTRAWWLAAAATLVAAVSLTALYGVKNDRDELTSAIQLASGGRVEEYRQLDSLRARIADRDRVIANLTGPQVEVMTLASAGPNAPSGRMFWNQSINAWTFVAHNLPKPAAGRTYQLWFVTAKEKISAGTFATTASGEAMMQMTYVLPKDVQLAAVAVTDEPEAGSPQPTTTPVLISAASTR